mgnify:CR=1 FL=1
MARCEECLHYEVCMYVNAKAVECARAENCKLFKHTADVVPKSKYDRLEKSFDELIQEAKGYLNRIYGIRADVASEIFADIEDCMKSFEDDDDGYLLKKCEFEFFMRELKKIYAEEKE